MSQVDWWRSKADWWHQIILGLIHYNLLRSVWQIKIRSLVTTTSKCWVTLPPLLRPCFPQEHCTIAKMKTQVSTALKAETLNAALFLVDPFVGDQNKNQQTLTEWETKKSDFLCWSESLIFFLPRSAPGETDQNPSTSTILIPTKAGPPKLYSGFDDRVKGCDPHSRQISENSTEF